jgi:hypothetical protein
MKDFNKKTGIIAFSALLSAVFLLSVSCSKTQPEISYGFIKLVLYQGETKPVENFSFFIIGEDSDGFENLEELYLFHDKEQLRWHFKSDEWISYSEGDKTWIGSRSITMHEGSLPRGVFRAVLVNKGGERGERNFTFDAVIIYPFPQFEVENGFYNIKSEWPSNSLVCYDRSGSYITTIPLGLLSGSISDLNIPAAVSTAALWADDASIFCSAFTNVVPIR